MKKTHKLSALIAVCALMLVPVTTHANPLQVTSSAQTAAATTTQAYMAVGTATSTLTYDSNQVLGTNQRNDGNTYSTNSALLLTQFFASSTSSTLNIGLEYSNDGIDWYADNLETITNASTSQAWNIAAANTYTWKFASTSPDGVAVGLNASTSFKAIVIPTPMRFARIFYSMTGAPGAVWGAIVPRKEVR